MSGNKFNNKYRVPSARWANWDYASEGAYFVTICTKHMEHYFGKIVNAEMQYSELGRMAVNEWIKSAEMRPDMELDMSCFQVMPNHIHGIVVIGRDGRDAMPGVSIAINELIREGGPGVSIANNELIREGGPGVSMVNNELIREGGPGVSMVNNEFIRDAKHGVCTGNGANFGPQSKNLASIMRGFKSAVTIQARILKIPFDWQTRYHDRVIRDDDEFRRIAAYIEQNPLNWEKK